MSDELRAMSDSIRRFEDMIAWQKSRALTAAIYRVTQESPFSRDFGLKDQIQRAAVSIMSNLAEGFERCNPAEFAHYIRIAKASCAELRTQLYVAVDVGHIANEVFARLLEQAEEVGRLIGGLRVAVERHRNTESH